MPGKWGARTGCTPPRSANELGCQTNGGRAPGAPPLDPPMTYDPNTPQSQSKEHFKHGSSGVSGYIALFHI